MNQNFEKQLQQDLYEYLLSKSEVDERFPDCPDVEGKWEEIARAYLPDGVREFYDFPTASLGWMMYIGMAVAKFWDDEWEIYGNIPDLYGYLRNKRGYDNLLQGEEPSALEKLAGDCASRVYSALRHQNIEPGTTEAFKAYVSCLHVLYLTGAAIQLKRMGYHMAKIN